MRKTFTFGGVNSGNYGVYISGKETFDSPARVVEMIDVPARNGQLTIDRGRFENIEVKYPSGIYGVSDADFGNKIRDFRNALGALTGYQRLVDDYHPDEFRMGLFSAGLKLSPTALRLSTFDIVFNCKPQRFLVAGETPTSFSATGTITNPTLFDAKPLLEIKGSGVLGVGDYSVTIQNTGSQSLFIDCDVMEAWTLSGGQKVNANDLVQYAGNQFPSLSAGQNGISLGSGITQVKVTPRWWRL